MGKAHVRASQLRSTMLELNEVIENVGHGMEGMESVIHRLSTQPAPHLFGEDHSP